MKVLILCHGNINRSAAGEIILKKMRPDLEIKSAGLKTKDGRITAKKMREALAERGYEQHHIRSTMITPELVAWADHIFYMDDGNENRLVDAFGMDVLEKSTRISILIDERKIPDPHYDLSGNLHRVVIDMLERAFAKIDLVLKKGRSNDHSD